MKVKRYIVAGRIGTEIIYPIVCKTQEEAEIKAQDVIYECAKRQYEWDEEDPVEDLDWDILDEWASDNGYTFWCDKHGGVFYDGNEWTEVEISTHEIEI